MPRYEFKDGTSSKFWEITLSGKSFTTTYGRIGTAGQSTTKKWGSDAEASKQYEKLIAEKVGKGYTQVGDDADGDDADGDEDQASDEPAPARAAPDADELKVREYEAGKGLKQAATTGWKLTLGFENYEAAEPLTNLLAQFLEEEGAETVRALVIGAWDHISEGGHGGEAMVEALAVAKAKLPALESIFFADVSSEESEISWIQNSDMGPLLAAYPKLKHFRVRGGQNLQMSIKAHPSLTSIVVEAGGLSSALVRQVAAADFPKLTHLELWLGTPSYGATWQMPDIAPILQGKKLPKLEYLGLCNSESADAIAEAVVDAPILGKIRTLDLSMGNISDKGAKALLASAAIKKLKALDLHHHYISDDVAKQFRGLGPKVDLSDQNEAEGDEDSDRYVEVSE